ncbi:MAG: T9SS type A sorting domain-containing protein [bacterium]|nr:T9SS type A sorting domain-containing protein [bacterium]
MKYFTLLLVLSAFNSLLFPQWQTQNSGTTENLNDVFILNQTSAIVIGNNGTILKTSNNGSEWISINSGTPNRLNAVSFRDNENGIAVGNEVICRTTDGGGNWNSTISLSNFLNVSYREIYFGGPNIIIGDENGYILYSSDDGNTWNLTLIFPTQPLIAVGFNYDSPSIHAPLAYIATTYNTGVSFFPSTTWNIYENPIIPAWDILTGGEFYDNNQYLVGWNGNPGPASLLLRRTDSDTTWGPIYSFVPGPYIPNDIKALNEILFVCGSDGKIFKSIDHGDNWTQQFTSITNSLNAISFRYDSIGYSVGDNGAILFTSNGGGINSVGEIIQPNEIVLYQNYPNPFNPLTNIEYKINSKQYVQLKIYDVLGNEITTLVNEEQLTGSYAFEFNPALTNLKISSGIYFYKISTSGEEGHFVQTKKMIYLK